MMQALTMFKGIARTLFSHVLFLVQTLIQLQFWSFRIQQNLCRSWRKSQNSSLWLTLPNLCSSAWYLRISRFWGNEDLGGFGRDQGGEGQGRLLFGSCVNRRPVIQISAGLMFWSLLHLLGKCEVVLIWSFTIISFSECVNKGVSETWFSAVLQVISYLDVIALNRQS